MAISKAKCECCGHPQRDQLDVQLARGAGISVVAEAFAVPVVTVVWHHDRHLTGLAKRTGANPHDLVDDLQYIKSRAENVLQAALTEEKLSIALNAIREMRESILALAKLTHAEKALDPLTYMPMFEQIKSRILKAVENHPEVRDRIVAALSGENESSDG